jgi:hypothetical protein
MPVSGKGSFYTEKHQSRRRVEVLYILLAAVVVAAVIVFGKHNAKTTQEIVGDTEITQDGLIRFRSGNTYRIVIEVEPKNLDMVSEAERKSVWTNFFSLINTLGIPYTLLAHSRLFEAKDYIGDLERRVGDLPDNKLKESGQHVIAHLRRIEDSHIRDISGYVILEYDPVAAAQVSSVSTGSAKLDSVVGKGGQSKMTEAEKAELAEQMLTDAAELVYGFCEQAGMRYQRLNRVGVLNVTYQMLQRDMAPQARMIDAVEADAFRPIKRSLTAGVMNHGKKG